MRGMEREDKCFADPIPDRSRMRGVESAPADRTTSFRALIEQGDESDWSSVRVLLQSDESLVAVLV